MPGHRKRRQFKQTDAFTRGMVIGLKRAGWSIRQIAADTHLGASTVHRLWRRWLEQGNVAIYRNVGATRVKSARVDRRILRQAVAAPQTTCTAILQHVQDTLDHSNSTRTISRRLVANGLHSCRPLRRLPLTPPNRRQRLEWCRARSTWMTEWHRVVFSDESRFCLSSDSRRVRVWRRHGERSNPAAIVERPTVRQRGIMVWGAIAYDSRSPLLRIQGTMTAQRYVDDVLRPVTLPYLQGVPNALYQQDNVRPHTARISQQALQDVQMLPWPPYSPDLSPIEHVWDIIGRRLHALPQPRSEDELWQMVEKELRAIPQDAIRTLIDSLPRRVAACIAVRANRPFSCLCLGHTQSLHPLLTSTQQLYCRIMSSQKRKRESITIEKKKDICQLARNNPTMSKNEIGERFSLPRTTARDILTQAEKWENYTDEATNHRSTVLNSTGTDKRRLLIIGKSAKPRCFRNFSPHLYCTYTSNSKAWMTSSIFQEWLLQFNKQLVSEVASLKVSRLNIASFNSRKWCNWRMPIYPQNYEAEMKLTDDNLLVSTVTAKEELGEDDDTTVTQRLPSLREARTETNVATKVKLSKPKPEINRQTPRRAVTPELTKGLPRSQSESSTTAQSPPRLHNHHHDCTITTTTAQSPSYTTTAAHHRESTRISTVSRQDYDTAGITTCKVDRMNQDDKEARVQEIGEFPNNDHGPTTPPPHLGTIILQLATILEILQPLHPRDLDLPTFDDKTDTTYSKFFAAKSQHYNSLEEYFRTKATLGMQLNLPRPVIIEALTEGLPTGDQRLVRVVPPKSLSSDNPPRMEGPYHNTPRPPPRAQHYAAIPPSPCKFCKGQHWHSQCQQRPASNAQHGQTYHASHHRQGTFNRTNNGRQMTPSTAPAAPTTSNTSPKQVVDYPNFRTYTPQLRNLDTINAIKPPYNQKSLQSFLGAVNIYNKFIPNYARLRTPLNNLLKKNVNWHWSDACQQAFETLKKSLTTQPVLHLFQEGLPCQLYCDASTQGIAGILKQVHPSNQIHPVQYYSRALRPHEQNYNISELECLAIIESVEKFRIYLTGTKFTIFSDHHALQWLKSIKNPAGRLFKWSLRLSAYDYEIRYIKGTQQYEADLLSRNPFCGFLDADTIKIYQNNTPTHPHITHDTIHVNKLRPYTEGVPHIAPPTMQAHIVQPKDNDLFPFRHLSPDLFQEYQLPTKPSSSQPLPPLTPNIFTLIQIEPTSSNNFSPVPQLQINHEPTQSQVKSSTLLHKWLNPQLISLIKHIGYNMKTFLIFHLILLIYTLTMPFSTVPLITLIYLGIYAQETDRPFQLQEAIFQLLTIICTLIGETVQRLFRTAPPPKS
ncbi:hypothetical protein LAZ67_1002628 [Cordylochernes scorpioides]|uniref:Uncharacterized protein n=1 Tax=Cordylochernes scorpioides TaxID=51811 RepID=A0ABY6JYZ8_9ARAC|nr:hypothetical protein LAZ67_1002628 [Cordylochernes scorpioides]